MDSFIVVNTPAATQDLTTIATVTDEVGPAGVSNQTLARWITEASSRIAAYCDRVFGRETVTETFLFRCGECRAALFLARTPVVSIDSVTVDGRALSATDYRVDQETGRLVRMGRSGASRWGGEMTEVTYTGGYELIGTLPPAIERACLDLVSERAAAGTSARPANLKSRELPGVLTETYWVDTDGSADELPPAIAGVLGPYRRTVL